MSDLTKKQINQIKVGEEVWTPNGNTKVKYLIEYVMQDVKEDTFCKIGDLIIGPYHPILINNKWEFPINIVSDQIMTIKKRYNLILNEEHIINVNGILSCTLGHGLKGDVIQNSYFGNIDTVLSDLTELQGFKEGYPIFKKLELITGDHDELLKLYDASKFPEYSDDINNLQSHFINDILVNYYKRKYLNYDEEYEENELYQENEKPYLSDVE
jgi:hypothetical protein